MQMSVCLRLQPITMSMHAVRSMMDYSALGVYSCTACQDEGAVHCSAEMV